MRPSAPTAQGTLDKTPVAHLFVYVLDRALTGTLDFVVDGSIVATVTTKDGSPTKIRTLDVEGLLGSILVDLGNVSAKQLSRALEEARARGRLLGSVLVEHGVVTEEEIVRALKLQLQRKLVRLFALPQTASYAYYDDFDGLEGFGGGGTTIEPLAVLWAGVKQSPPLPHVTATVARVAGHRLALLPQAAPDRLSLTRLEKEVVAKLREAPQSLDDLATLGALPPSGVELLAYALLITKQVEIVVDPGGDGRRSSNPSEIPLSTGARPVARAEDERPSSVPVASESVPNLSETGASPVARMRITKSVQRRPFAVEEEITANGRDGRRGTPPPRKYLDPQGDIPEPDSSGVIEKPADPHAGLRESMKARIASAATATHFELLEISQDASAADATAAYMRLVKTWHPDKVPAALAELRSAASTVFAKMTEAHSVWTNATKRQEYLATLASGVSKKDEEELVNRALKAMTEFQKAEVFYRKKDLVNAELCVKNALELDGSQCDYIAFAAWMEASRREDADAAALKRWLGELDRALAIHSKSDRALYYRGMIHKRAGNDKAAQRDFRDACDHNPKNVDAQRELRLFAMRQGASTPPPSPPATGLLGRLFKK